MEDIKLVSPSKIPGVPTVEGIGYKAQSFASLLKAPIVALIIAFVLFGPIVISSFMKFLPSIPLHIWIVLFVIFWGYRLIK